MSDFKSKTKGPRSYRVMTSVPVEFYGKLEWVAKEHGLPVSQALMYLARRGWEAVLSLHASQRSVEAIEHMVSTFEQESERAREAEKIAGSPVTPRYRDKNVRSVPKIVSVKPKRSRHD